MGSEASYNRYWIAGTDTDVGKTLVSAVVVQGLQSSYWKPIQSGIMDGTDTGYVQKLTGLKKDHFIPEVYKFKQPLSPHLAARLDGGEVHTDSIFAPDPALIKNGSLVIEGAGGLLVPLNGDSLMIDLMKQIEAPVILVCRSSLGTINHSLLSIRVLKEYGFNIMGFVMNGPENLENEKAVIKYGQIEHLGSIPHLKSLTREVLTEVWNNLRIKDKIVEIP
jgi:dethiobiotin synthetase